MAGSVDPTAPPPLQSPPVGYPAYPPPSPPPYGPPVPIYYPPPPRSSNIVLIVVVIVVAFVAVAVVASAVLYFLAAGLTTDGGPPSDRPIVTFASPNTITNGFMFRVAQVSLSFPPSNYRVNLQLNSTIGSAVPLSPTMTIVLRSTTHAINWIDFGGEGILSAGDAFEITAPGGLRPSTTYTFYLLWSDGTVLRTLAFTTQ